MLLAPEPPVAAGAEPSRHTRSVFRTLVQIGGVAVAYLGAGKLALLLAIPPGYATAVWPAAGIALSCVLLFGYRVLPGIAIGSFFVNIDVGFDASSAAAVARSLSIATSIATGAALEAAAGAILVRRFVSAPLRLEREHDIARFLLLGGPVACVVSASWGVTTLVAAGSIPAPTFAFSWFTWWVGDVIGTTIFAPLVIALVAGSEYGWRRRRAAVVLPLALGFGVVTAFFIRVSEWENQRADAEFARRGRVLATALERRLDQSLDVVRSVTNLYTVKRDVTRADFRTFVRGRLGRDAIAKVGWVPRVSGAERASYETAMRRDGFPTFQITVMAPRGDAMVRAPDRDEHFPISFAEPLEGNEALLGFDMGSESTRVRSLHRARDEGVLVATPVVELVPPRGARAVLVLAPVFDERLPHANVAERRHALRGMVVGVITASLVAGVLAGLDHRGMSVRVLSEQSLLLGSNGDTGSPGLRWSTPIDVAGSTWTFECTAVGPLERSWQAWTVLAGGLLFVGLLGGVQLLVTGRTEQVIASEARKVTLIASLQASEQRLRLAQEVARIGTFEWDIQTHVNTWTPEMELMHGLPIGGFGRTLEAWLDLVHPDDRAEAMRLVATSFNAPDTTEGEWRVVWPDGTTHWLAARWQILKDASGTPLRMTGINMDITARKRSEAERERLLGEIQELGRNLESRVAERTRELATAQRRMEGIIEIAADAIISIDEHQRITIFNKGAEEIFGWSRDEVLGRDLDVLLPDRIKLVHREHLAAFAGEPAVARRMAERRPVYGRRKNGEEFPAEAAISKLQTPTELLFTVILRDISARQRLEEERARIFDERGVLLKEIHHRVKNNLQVISSLFAMQGRSTADRALRSLLDESRNRIQSIALVHDQLYRASNLAEIDFDAYLRDEIVGIQSAYAPITGGIVVELDARGLVLDIDQAVPCGLLVNELVSNAFKHAFAGRPSGKVRVAVHETQTEVVIDITDDGIGMPPNFDWRATPTLGLQLVQSLTGQLRGTVELDTAHGTRFTVRFPHLRKPRTEASARTEAVV